VDYIVTLLLWHRAGQFEMPEGLAVELLKLTMSEVAAKESARPVGDNVQQGADGDRFLLQKPFGLNEFMRLVYRAGVVDSSGTRGLTYCALQQLYGRVWSQIAKHMEHRASALKWAACPQEFTRHECGLIGRHELAILLHELWKDAHMQARFSSPLYMSVRFIQRASTLKLSPQRRRTRSSSLPQVRPPAGKTYTRELDILLER